MSLRQGPLGAKREFIIDSLPEVEIDKITFKDLHPILTLHQGGKRINERVNRFIVIELLNITTTAYRKPVGSCSVIHAQKTTEFLACKSITKHRTYFEPFCIRPFLLICCITFYPTLILAQTFNSINNF